MDKANPKTKKPFFRGVLDGFRSTVGGSSSPKVDVGIEETLASEHFQVTKTVRHGFPFQPTAFAYDPVQNLLAIGTKSGSIRIFGQPGVDCHVKHENEVAVIQLMFLVNEGALVSACADDQLHLWSLRQKKPEIIHSLKFQRERITFCHLPFQSKWLYVGTDRGNVHVVNLESFALSGYLINWNKTIELLRKSHPGPVVHLSDNQMDTSKLLIGYESGLLALWDLKNKTVEHRFNCSEPLKSACWHHEGKQFICSHNDGSLTVWNVKSPQQPQSAMMPHAKLGRDGKPEPCRAITKVELRTNRNSEPYIIFCGGMPCEKSFQTSTVTIMHGTSTTVLELEHTVIDFVTICSTPWNNDFQDPYAVAVLLQNDFVMVDLTSPNYPCFENPYPMDLHESPVTACLYFADCPPDLIPAFYSVGCKQKKSGYSEKEWPVKGGIWGSATCSYPEIIITGHADGSLKFWDASTVMLQVLYKMKTAKLFDESRSQPGSDSPGDSPFAILHLHLCVESRLLCIAGSSHVALFNFSRQESQIECTCIEVSIMYEVCDESDSPEPEFSSGPTKQTDKDRGSQSTPGSGDKEAQTCLKLKSGSRKWSAGYQPELCCLLTCIDNEPPPPITSLSFNSRYGLLAFGNECGLAVIDVVQKSCLISIGTPDLYGSLDPYSRASRSPKQKSRPQGFESLPQATASEDFKPPPTPVVDQLSPDRPHRSSWEFVDATSEPVHGSSVRSSESLRKSSFPTEEPECELGCDALEVFETGGESVVPESVDGCESAHCLEEADSASKCTDTVPGGKMDWIRKLSHPKRKKLTVQKTILRHCSAPACVVDTKTSPRLSPKWSEDSAQPNGSHFSVDTPLIVPHQNTGNISPRQLEKLQPVTCSTIASGSDHPELSDRTHMPVTPMTAPPMSAPPMTAPPMTAPPMTAPPMTLRHNEPTLVDRMNRKLLNYLKVVRTLRPDKGFDDHARNWSRRKRQESRVFQVNDLTSDSLVANPSVITMNYTEYLALDKTDSFSRSQSSSMSSLDNINKEAIQCLAFNDAFARKSDNFLSSSLWAGTSLGTVLVMSVSFSEDPESRKSEPVVISPTGTIFRLKGAVVAMSFLDSSGVLVPTPADRWNDKNREETAKEKKPYSSKPDGQQSASNMKARISPASSGEFASDQQFVVLCSEKQARVIALPSQTCAYKVKITETSSVAKADIVSFKESVCLACYLVNGHIMTFSLPSLKPLLDVDYIPFPDVRVARTFCFSSNCHALYFCSPSELQKLTLSAEMSESLKEMLSEIFIPCDMPEAPKPSFFKNLFNVGSATLDREELFGEGSGKAPKGVVKYTSGISGAQENASMASSEIGRAKMLALERGEKLGELEDRTDKMRLDAELYSQAAQQMKNKYKDKKWYQL